MLTTAANTYSLTPARAKSRAGIAVLFEAASKPLRVLSERLFSCLFAYGDRRREPSGSPLPQRYCNLRPVATRLQSGDDLNRLEAHTMTRPSATRRPESGFLALSFVRRSKRHTSNWHLPAPPSTYVEAQRVNSDGSRNSRDTALYGIGCTQGSAAAREYLSALRACHGDTCGGWLQHFVLAMLDAPRDNLLRGQIVGFFTALEAEVTL